MFYYLEGKLELTDDNIAVIDCAGVGYSLTVSNITLSNLTIKIGQTVRLYTYLAVREDGVELFGFGSKEEKNAFLLLITVSGVGPKAALNILSILSYDELFTAIVTENVKAISKANGVGAKTAARIVLDLKEKVSDVGLSIASTPEKTAAQKATLSPNLKEASEALLALGYDKNSVARAVSDIDPSLHVTQIIRLALKKMSQ